MKIDWRRLGLTVLVAALVFLLLTGFFWDFVRDTIAVPIYFLLWAANLILSSIAQQVYLVLLIVVCGVIGINALSKIRLVAAPEYALNKQPATHSRYHHWQALCEHAHSSAYSRERFALEARKLILSVLADLEGTDAAQIQARVQDGSLPVPETIRTLITVPETQLTFEAPKTNDPARRRWLRLFGIVEPSQIDSHINEIADFIERLMERKDAQPDPQG